jgi:hypothetical protein
MQSMAHESLLPVFLAILGGVSCGCGGGNKSLSPSSGAGGTGAGAGGTGVGVGGNAPAMGAPLIAGTTTVRGNVFTSQHTGEPGQKVYLTALDGPPEVKQAYASVVAAYPMQGSVGAEAAVALADQFTAQLTYNVDGPAASALFGETQYTGRSIYDLTGAVSVKNGVTFLTLASYGAGDAFQYSAHMLDPSVAIVSAGKAPLVLTVGSQTMTFLYVPPGQFLMGEPYYTMPSWQEDPPHLVTITKGYYLAETPITWALYQAATGTDLRTGGEDPQAAANLSCANAYALAQALAKMSGKTVRPPTAAELVYAFRAGTSDPPFAQKYSGAGIVAAMLAPVKATKPNAWGFYEWVTDQGWERSGDSPTSDHHDTTDPRYTPPEDPGNPTQAHPHSGYGRSEYAIGELEYIDSNAGPVSTYPNLIRERVLVEE